MKILFCLKAAREMGISRQFAVNARQRFITGRLDEIDGALDSLMPWLENGGVNAAFVEPEICDLLIEKCQLIKEVQFMKTEMNREPEITDEMIERARQVPVPHLIEFRRGKATAWCHEDRNPSLYFGSRTNKAVCPVCDKKFGPIDILMQRDGMSFKEAVKGLAGR